MSYAARPDISIIIASPHYVGLANVDNAEEHVDRLHRPILRPSSNPDTFAVSYYNRHGKSPRVINTRFKLGLDARSKTVIFLEGVDRAIPSVDELISIVERLNPAAYRSNNNGDPQPVRNSIRRSSRRSRMNSRRSRMNSRRSSRSRKSRALNKTRHSKF